MIFLFQELSESVAQQGADQLLHFVLLSLEGIDDGLFGVGIGFAVKLDQRLFGSGQLEFIGGLCGVGFPGGLCRRFGGRGFGSGCLGGFDLFLGGGFLCFFFCIQKRCLRYASDLRNLFQNSLCQFLVAPLSLADVRSGDSRPVAVPALPASAWRRYGLP